MTEKEFEEKVDRWAINLENKILKRWGNKKLRLIHNSVSFTCCGGLIVASYFIDHSKNDLQSKILFGLGSLGVIGTIVTIKTTERIKK